MMFTRRLLDLESRLDSRNLDWYVDNLDNPVMDYWQVERLGRLVRDAETGAPVTDRITIAEFLRRTGVAELFENSAGITAVQAAVINPWGFVGFQFGEGLLIDLQYYRPVCEAVVLDGEEIKLPSYYAPALAERTWRGGTTSHVHLDEGTGHWQLARYPADIYARPLRRVFTYVLPLAVVASAPARVLARPVDALLVLGALVTTAAAVLVAILVWRTGLRRYTGASS